MSRLTLAQVIADTAGRLVAAPGLAVEAVACQGVSTDTRTLSVGQLFVALRGPSFDAHEFLATAHERGAVAALVERPDPALPLAQVVVSDARRALGQLAAAHRRRLSVRVVGITGSVGKTTTKELLAAVLGHSAPTLFTLGNLNNDIGVPLTLLRLGPEHRYAVVEMGMSAPGEIAYLAGLAAPEVGLVTRVAPAHLLQMKTLEAIADAKAELFSAIGEEGAIVYPSFDPLLRERAQRARAGRKISFGTEPTDTVRIEEIKPVGQGTMMNVSLAGGGVRCIGVPLLGRHNALNAAAAAGAAFALGLSADAIALGLSYARPAKRRSELRQLAERRVIDDCYNANPVSTKAALDMLADARRQASSVAVLGDMLELGPEEQALHVDVGLHAARSGLSALVAFGPLGRAIARGAREGGMTQVYETADPQVAARLVLELSRPGDWVLFKASRGTRLERVLEAFAELARAGQGGREA